MRESGSGRRWVDRKGTPFTLRTYAPTSPDAYEDPTVENATAVTINGVVVIRTGQEALSITVAGRTYDINSEIYIRDDVTVKTDKRPMIIEDADESWEVVVVDQKSRRGTQRLLCSKRELAAA